MVNIALPAFATLALVSVAGAVPTAAEPKSDGAFSLADWAKGVAANPNGDNLTPVEAVQAWRMALPGVVTVAMAATAKDVEDGKTFSWSDWVEGIANNPDGDNLTPEEAYDAWRESLGLPKDVEPPSWIQTNAPAPSTPPSTPPS